MKQHIQINLKNVVVDTGHAGNHFFTPVWTVSEIKGHAFKRQSVGGLRGWEGKFYRPILEKNIGAFHLIHETLSIVPESLFFTHPDREAALSLIEGDCADFLRNHAYHKMNEAEVFVFVSKRVREREKFNAWLKKQYKSLKLYNDFWWAYEGGFKQIFQSA